MSDQIGDQKEAYAAEMRDVSGQATPAETTPAAPKTDAPETAIVEPVAKDIDSATFDINSLPPAAKLQWEATQKRLKDFEERNQKLDTENRSYRGRVPHLESKLARWENEHRRAAQPPRAQQPAAAQPPPDKKAPAASSLQALPGWQKLRQTFADDAGPLEEVFNAVEAQNRALTEDLAKTKEMLGKLNEAYEKDITPRFKSLDDLQADRAREQYDHATQEVFKARESLVTKYPDYKSHIVHKYDEETGEITETLMSDQFAEWVQNKPRSIQGLFGGDATQEDVDYGLDLFYRDAVRPASDAGKQSEAEAALKARQDQLTRRSVTSSNGTAMNAEGKLSESERFRREMQTNFS